MKRLVWMSAAVLPCGLLTWRFTRAWEGWEPLFDMARKGDNLSIAGLIPVIGFFMVLSLRQGLANDRLLEHDREDEILEEMYK